MKDLAWGVLGTAEQHVISRKEGSETGLTTTLLTGWMDEWIDGWMALMDALGGSTDRWSAWVARHGMGINEQEKPKDFDMTNGPKHCKRL